MLNKAQIKTSGSSTRNLLKLVDETIAKESVCRFCGGEVKLDTSADDQPYEAWLVCTNAACQRKSKIT